MNKPSSQSASEQSEERAGQGGRLGVVCVLTGALCNPPVSLVSGHKCPSVSWGKSIFLVGRAGKQAKNGKNINQLLCPPEKKERKELRGMKPEDSKTRRGKVVPTGDAAY